MDIVLRVHLINFFLVFCIQWLNLVLQCLTLSFILKIIAVIDIQRVKQT
jgi:hypothetical protein